MTHRRTVLARHPDAVLVDRNRNGQGTHTDRCAGRARGGVDPHDSSVAGVRDPCCAGTERDRGGTIADGDRGDDAAGPRVDSAHASLAAVCNPHGAATDGDPGRGLANVDGVHNGSGLRVDVGDRVRAGIRHPDCAVARGHAARLGVDRGRGDDLVPRRVDDSDRVLRDAGQRLRAPRAPGVGARDTDKDYQADGNPRGEPRPLLPDWPGLGASDSRRPTGAKVGGRWRGLARFGRGLDGWAGNAVQPPRPGNALQGSLAAVLEAETRSGGEVANGVRHDELGSAGGRHDAGRGRHGDSADLGPDLLDLADVQAGPDFDAECPHGLDCVECAGRGLGRSVEDREEPVAGRVHLAAAVAPQRRANDAVMLLDEVAPTPVTELSGKLGRTDDVREQDGGEEALGLALPAARGHA